MPKPRTRKLGNINLNIPDQLHTALFELSVRNSRTVSDEVRRALRQYVKRHGFDIESDPPPVVLGRPKKKKT